MAASRPASNKSWLCLMLMGPHEHLRASNFLSAEDCATGSAPVEPVWGSGLSGALGTDSAHVC